MIKSRSRIPGWFPVQMRRPALFFDRNMPLCTKGSKDKKNASNEKGTGKVWV